VIVTHCSTIGDALVAAISLAERNQESYTICRTVADSGVCVMRSEQYARLREQGQHEPYDPKVSVLASGDVQTHDSKWAPIVAALRAHPNFTVRK
jgi:hypothetical protein